MIARILSKVLGLAILPATQANTNPLPLPGHSEGDRRYDLTLTGFLPVSTTGTPTIDGKAAPFDLGLN